MNLVEFMEYLLNGNIEGKTPEELTLTDNLSLNKTISNFKARTNITFTKKSNETYTYSNFTKYCSDNIEDYKNNDGVYSLINNTNNKPDYEYTWEVSPTPDFDINQTKDNEIIIDGMAYLVDDNGKAEVIKKYTKEEVIEEEPTTSTYNVTYDITCLKIVENVYTKSFGTCNIIYTDIYGDEQTKTVNYADYNNIFNLLFRDNLTNGNNEVNNNTGYTYTYEETPFQLKNEPITLGINIVKFDLETQVTLNSSSAYDLSKFTLKKELPVNFFKNVDFGETVILVDYSKISITNRKVKRIGVSKVIASTKLLSLINEDTKVPSQDYMNFLEERIKGLENEIAESKVNHVIPTTRPANPVNGSIWIQTT